MPETRTPLDRSTDLELIPSQPSREDRMPGLALSKPPAATVAAEDASPDVTAVHGYLARYGYFPNAALATRYPMWRPAMAFDVPDPGVMDEHMQQAVRLFQGANGLDVTGEVDEPTLELMSRPRCGVPDSPVATGLQVGAFVAQGNRWPGPTVTFSHDGSTPDLSQAQVRAALRAAFDRWAAVTPLSFAESPSGAGEIRISFASGDHGDGAQNAFDGPSGTLAHCFFPPPNGGPLAGDCHFDEAETWTVGDPVTGIDLDTVALHELGHGIGLDHSDVNAAVMFAFYGGARRELHADDVAGAQAIYGTRFRWGSLGGVITSSIAVANNADGRLEIFARGTDGALWHQWQTAPSAGPWSGWSGLGGGIVGTPAVGQNADGRLEVFVRGTDGALWHQWQVAPNGTWSGWSFLGGGIRNPVVGRNADGRMEVFVRGDDGAVWNIWQVSPNGTWSGWNSLGGVITTGIGVGNNADGRLEVFVRGTDGALWHQWQTAPSSGPWSGWASRGGGILGTPAVGRNADGRLEVFVRGTDSSLWHIWQGAPGTWGGWSPLGGVLTSDLTVGNNADGRMEVFGRGTDRALWHLWQTAPNSSWSGWSTLSGGIDLPVVGRNGDGRLEVFVKGDDAAVWNTWQSRPDGVWN